MAKVAHCVDTPVRTKVFRLPSSKSAYTFQHTYWNQACKFCFKQFLYWQGEYPNGTRTELFEIPEDQHDYWLRRIQAGEAKPEAQLVSEYTRRIAGEIMAQGDYQTKLCRAHRWYKGERVLHVK